MKIEKFTVFSPGTCGELMQGKINGADFLVTAPINLFSKVTISIKEGKPEFLGLNWKARKAIEIFTERFQLKLDNISLSLSSSIPQGKGMASSSADIGGVIYALSRFYEISLTPFEIAKLALEIEPTDGIMFPGIVAFDHKKGSFWEYIGKPFPLKILIVDFGGEIDTIDFNKIRDFSYDEEFSKYLFLNLKKAFKEKNLELFGKIITESTLQNQKIIFKRNCESIIKESLKLGAIGINTAHSGTVCGIYTPYSKKEDVDKIQTLFPDISFLGWYDFIGGGHLIEM